MTIIPFNDIIPIGAPVRRYRDAWLIGPTNHVARHGFFSPSWILFTIFFKLKHVVSAGNLSGCNVIICKSQEAKVSDPGKGSSHIIHPESYGSFRILGSEAFAYPNSYGERFGFFDANQPPGLAIKRHRSVQCLGKMGPSFSSFQYL